MRGVLGLVLMAALSLAPATAVLALEVGDKAPDFTLNGPDGKPVKLTDLTGKGPVVIYTFVAAFSHIRLTTINGNLFLLRGG